MDVVLIRLLQRRVTVSILIGVIKRHGSEYYSATIGGGGYISGCRARVCVYVGLCVCQLCF